MIGPGAAARPRPSWLIPALLFATVALAARLPLFGNPVIDTDEAFYLLVGGRLLHGVLPYVDIWDRKPIGLFLIYAAASALGGNGVSGVLAYQIMAWASVAATSGVIYRLSRMIAPRRGAIWAGVSYPLYLMVFNCAGGQSPAFYNLLVACAALLLASEMREPESAGLARRGAAAMLLIGVALQIKYTVVFEGLAFGIALLWRGFGRLSAGRLIASGALWIGCAVLPTALVLAWYASIGHGAEFIQSNFASVFGRSLPFWPSLWRLTKEMLALAPFWLAIVLSARRLTADEAENAAARPFLLFWAAAALGGFLIFGSWFDHYAAPLLPPLAVLSAPALGRAGKAFAVTGFLLAVGLIAGIAVTVIDLRERGNARQVDSTTELIRSHLAGGCLYVFEAQPVFYRTTDSCLPSRFVFPAHLSDATEAGALGVSPIAEERKILDRKPAVVMIGLKPMEQLPALDTRRMLTGELRNHYSQFATVVIGGDLYDLYERRFP
jgi:4-amino-4-deoxy-L-arabinose transferase-like glycosyltransferase